MKNRFLAVLFLLSIHLVYCEHLNSPSWGYSLDLPENFVLSNRDGNSRYLFQHQILPVDLQIALYSVKEFSNVEKMSKHIITQLKLNHKDISFIWANKNAILSMINFEHSPSENYQKKELSGWLLTLELPNQKGFLVLLTYTDKEKAKQCEPLMISTLDTVFTNEISYLIPGPITKALYSKTNRKEISYSFNNKNIKFKISATDIEANKSVIDREFQLLTLYLNQETIFDAWKRFYRVIFKDAWDRIKPFSVAIQSAYPELLKDEKLKKEKIAEEILMFVQNFKYTRDHQGSDLINLPQAILEKKGDCDARSLLMALILKQMNIDSILLVSPNKKHSILAIDCQGSGSFFEYNNKKYLMVETTSHDKLGKIDETITNPKNWFVVDFFY